MGPKMQHILQAFIDAGRIPTALSEAARWGEIDMVRQLLGKGVPVDARDEGGGTALMNAASGGEVAILCLLIERGADVNATDGQKGMTALMWCLAALHPDDVYLAIVRALLNSLA